MTKYGQSLLSAFGAAVLFSTVSVSNVQAAPNDIVSRGEFKVLGNLVAPGTRNPDGPEFVAQYPVMHEADYTYNKNGVRGRAIDCDDLVAGEKADGTGLEFKLTARFVARAGDIKNGGPFDKAFDQDGSAVVGSDFLQSYGLHLEGIHHRPLDEVIALGQYCNINYGPGNQ